MARNDIVLVPANDRGRGLGPGVQGVLATADHTGIRDELDGVVRGPPSGEGLRETRRAR